MNEEFLKKQISIIINQICKRFANAKTKQEQVKLRSAYTDAVELLKKYKN